jgi:flagellar basal body rod protein FlgC
MKELLMLTISLVAAVPLLAHDPVPVAKVFLRIADDDPVSDFLKTTPGMEKSGSQLLVFNEFADRSLETLLNYYQTGAAVAIQNIENKNTTRTADGGPYQRKVVQITADGTIVVEPVKNQEFRLVYNPSFPDAVKTGPKAGYVEYPNINKKDELNHLRYCIDTFNAFAALGEKLDPTRVIEKLSFSDYLMPAVVQDLESLDTVSQLASATASLIPVMKAAKPTR